MGFKINECDRWVLREVEYQRNIYGFVRELNFVLQDPATKDEMSFKTTLIAPLNAGQTVKVLRRIAEWIEKTFEEPNANSNTGNR